jgi:hypothetical protein
MLVAVGIEAAAEPARYRCELVRRSADGSAHATTLAWTQPPRTAP